MKTILLQVGLFLCFVCSSLQQQQQQQQQQKQTTETDSLVNCTLCEDGSKPNDLSARFSLGLETLSCETVFDRGVYSIPQSNCTFLQSRGRAICYCNRQVPTLNPDCTLCDDGGPLPNPNLEGLPGQTCALVQATAIRDAPEACPAHQATVGVYCQCTNNTYDPNTVCRICQDNLLLPSPLLQVRDQNDNIQACAALELEANKNPAQCGAFQQQYREECCADLVIPTAAPTSNGVTTKHGFMAASTVSTVLLLVLLMLPQL